MQYMSLNLNVALLVLRVFIGLVVASHGAQKMFGWFGGSGLVRWIAGVETMGFRPTNSSVSPESWASSAAGCSWCLAF
jgi:putative oxidoreductase